MHKNHKYKWSYSSSTLNLTPQFSSCTQPLLWVIYQHHLYPCQHQCLEEENLKHLSPRNKTLVSYLEFAFFKRSGLLRHWLTLAVNRKKLFLFEYIFIKRFFELFQYGSDKVGAYCFSSSSGSLLNLGDRSYNEFIWHDISGCPCKRIFAPTLPYQDGHQMISSKGTILEVALNLSFRHVNVKRF